MALVRCWICLGLLLAACLCCSDGDAYLVASSHLPIGRHTKTTVLKRFTDFGVDDMTPSYIVLENGDRVAYRCTMIEKNSTSSLGILFCPGFCSTMEGSKATTLETFCKNRGLSFCRFDYRGHGMSDGRFEDLTLSDWIEDAFNIIRHVFGLEKKIVIVGSSMGGWIALHLASRMPTQIVGFVGVAAAPNFVEDIFSRQELLEPEKNLDWERKGYLRLATEYSEDPYTLTWSLLQDARENWNALQRHNNGGSIKISCPVRLLHGQNDKDIDWTKSLDLMNQLGTTDVSLSLVKDGDHRLSRPQDLAKLCLLLEEFI